MHTKCRSQIAAGECKGGQKNQQRFSSLIGGRERDISSEFIHDFVHAHASPRVFPFLAKFFPRLGRNGLGGFKKRRGLIKLQNVPRLEMETLANMDGNGDLPFRSKRCLHE